MSCYGTIHETWWNELGCLNLSSGFWHAVFISSERNDSEKVLDQRQQQHQKQKPCLCDWKMQIWWLEWMRELAFLNLMKWVCIGKMRVLSFLFTIFCIRQKSQELKWAAMPAITYSAVLLLMPHGFWSQPKCTGDLCENQSHICWNFYALLKSCQVLYQWKGCTLKIKVHLSWKLGNPNSWGFFPILYYILRGGKMNGLLSYLNMFLCLCLNFLQEN